MLFFFQPLGDAYTFQQSYGLGKTGVELYSGKKIRDIETNGIKYLRIIEYDKINASEMEEYFRREYLRKTKLIIGSKLNGRNNISAMNT